MNELRKAVAAVAEHAMLLAEHGRSVFRIEGVDALDLLHRLSTNDLLKGSGDRSVMTVFCDERGRVIDAVEIVSAGKDRFMICSASGSETLLRWIEKFTITEDIHLRNISDVYSIDCIIGPQAVKSMKGVSLERAWTWQGRFGILPCVRILSAKDLHEELTGELLKKELLLSTSSRTYEFLRVLHSVPLHGHEVTDSYNPYEVGLAGALSFTKGCYIGQEVIARLDTYQRVQRQLRMLWSDASGIPQPGTPVVVAGEQAGAVTSATTGLGRTIILAPLRNEMIRSHEVFRVNDFPYVLNDTNPLPYSLIFRQGVS